MHDIAVISERSGGLLKSRTPMKRYEKVNGGIMLYIHEIIEHHSLNRLNYPVDCKCRVELEF